MLTLLSIYCPVFSFFFVLLIFSLLHIFFFFFFNDTATTEIYTLSLHDALPICSFLREADRTVIAGDCVLKRITPNPILSPDPIDKSRRFRSLAEYLVSLARLRAFAPTLVHGGHGEIGRASCRERV